MSEQRDTWLVFTPEDQFREFGSFVRRRPELIRRELRKPLLKERTQAAIELRKQGLYYDEIGALFGISGQAIRNDLQGLNIDRGPRQAKEKQA